MSDVWTKSLKSITDDMTAKPSKTPKNCLNKEIIESNNFATPETRFFAVISSNAFVIANPGIKIIMADSMVMPTLNSGNTKYNRQARIVTTKEINDSTNEKQNEN